MKSICIKTSFPAIILLFCLSAFAQTPSCDSIIWRSNRKLTWDDFRALPQSSKTAAQTHYNFTREWSVQGRVLKTRMICFFSPCLSWTKSAGSGKLLAHEQGHFDLAEAYRRIYYKRVMEADFNPARLERMMKRIYRDINEECDSMQRAYDTETGHSTNSTRQAEWLLKIAGLLESNKAYDKDEITLELPN